MTVKTWLSKKKNQRLVFFILGVVLLYLYLKQRSQPVNSSVYQPIGGRTDAIVGGVSTSTPGTFTPYNAASLPYTHTNKDFFTLVKNGSAYSDTYPGDSVVGGLRKITANGRTYTAYYWINEIPYANGDGTPKNFVDVVLPPGCFISIRKVYADSNWVTTHQQIFDQGSEAWYLNGGADQNRTYKTVMLDITT